MRRVLQKLLPALAFLMLVSSAWAQCINPFSSRAVTLESPTAKYWLVITDDCSYWLLADVDGVQVTVAKLRDGLFYWLELVGDFDNDGVADVLLAGHPGGTYGQTTYFVASAFSSGPPTIAEIPDTSWQDIEFGDGLFTLRSNEWIRHYRYVGGEILVSEDRVFARFPAVASIDRLFPINLRSDIEPIDIDLDEGGDYLQVGCNVGRSLSCTAYQPNGTELHIVFGCDRVGFLNSRTLGFRDVVCDDNLIGKWDGIEYVFEPEHIICAGGATSSDDLYKLAQSFSSYSPEVRQEMLACGATNEWSSMGVGPFFGAVVGNEVEALRALAEYGHDPNFRSSSGVRPLMFAVETSEPRVVTELLAIGASPSLASLSGDPFEVLAAAARNPALEGSSAMLALMAAIVAEQSAGSTAVPVNVSFEEGDGPALRLPPEVYSPTRYSSSLEYRLGGGGVGRNSNEDEPIIVAHSEMVITVDAVSLSFPVELNYRNYVLTATFVVDQAVRATGPLGEALGGEQEPLGDFIDLQLVRQVRTPASRNVFAFGDAEADEAGLDGLGLTSVGSLMVGSALVTNGTWTPSVGDRLKTTFRKDIDPDTVVSLNHLETVAAASAEGFEVNGIEESSFHVIQDHWDIHTEVLVEKTSSYVSHLRYSSATPTQVVGEAQLRFRMLTVFGDVGSSFVDMNLTGPFEVSSVATPWASMPADRLEYEIEQLTDRFLDHNY